MQLTQEWVVIKFGGTSVQNLTCWQNIKSIIETETGKKNAVFVVCSAITGVSNLLEKIYKTASKAYPEELILEIEGIHKNFCNETNVPFDLIKEDLTFLKKMAQGVFLLGQTTPSVEAKIMSLGELMLTKLAHRWLLDQKLETHFLDARTFLKTNFHQKENPNRHFKTASCCFKPDEELKNYLLSNQHQVVLTQGFIASDHENQTVILGRGGSDSSAAYFASKLSAKELQIWSDVPGLFTADPRFVPDSRLIKLVSYIEAEELASSGAKVLHPHCLEPVKQYNIPVKLRWTKYPSYDGTTISAGGQNEIPNVKAVISKSNIVIISMDSTNMWQEFGFLANVFNCFAQSELSVDLVSTSQTNVTVSLDNTLNSTDAKIIEELFASLSEFCKPKLIESCSSISLVGNKIRSILHKISPALEVFKEKEIYLMSQSASDLNFSFVVDKEEEHKIIAKLHESLFNSCINDPSLGESWEELKNKENITSPKEPKKQAWWEEKSEALKDLFASSNESSLYVYDLNTVKNRIEELQEIKAVSRMNYALKANHHPSILELCYKMGLGFDCVSLEEIDYVFAHVLNLKPDHVIFTPNFAPLEEYKKAFEKGVLVTVDNASLLMSHPSIFADKEIFLRIDPGSSDGHHKHVKTGGNNSKFGIPIDHLEDLALFLKKNNTQVLGLHAHTGSGIKNPNNWSKIAHTLVECKKYFPEITTLDLGGGFGITERDHDHPLNLQKVEESLQEIKTLYPSLQLWIEPGRFIVAEAGALLAKVTQKKTKGPKNFLGISTGMNSLVRYAMYGAFHKIVNLSRLQQPKDTTYDIVGPICESGDILGHDRLLPKETSENDILLIANAGAYGKVMSSHYNLRVPAKEIIF